MFQPKEEACWVRIASSGCRFRRGHGSVAVFTSNRECTWVTRHDTKLPHDFLERGADREIHSLVNHGTVWKASDMTKADTVSSSRNRSLRWARFARRGRRNSFCAALPGEGSAFWREKSTCSARSTCVSQRRRTPAAGISPSIQRAPDC